MYRLYDFLPSGNGYKVRLALTQLGIPFELIELDILSGETRTPEFLARNPNGRIPVLEIEPGSYLPESNAILWYLAHRTALVPTGRLARAQVLQWQFFEQYSLEPNLAVARFWLRFLRVGEERRAALAAKQRAGKAALGVLEQHLATRDYLVGGRYSIADLSLYAYAHVAEEGGVSLAPFPAVGDWLGRVRAQPGHIPITARPGRGDR
jgi:glutathione S-transferase